MDVRLVAATNKNLESLVAVGKFREDLFFRIRVVQIQLPPLRDRVEDIPVLAEHFLREFGRENQKQSLEFSREVLDRLITHSWPGNIRELRTAVEHGVVMAKGKTVEVTDLPPGIRQDRAHAPVREGRRGETLEDLEREAIRRALEGTGHNITEAARELGISRRTLHRKLAESKMVTSKKR